MINRVILIVMDSAGIGELPDAAKYNDQGSNTIGNIARDVKGFRLPNLQKIGIGNIVGFRGLEGTNNPSGCFGRADELSEGKDTTTGHWEISGIVLEKAFPTYPNGFPLEVIEGFEKSIGTKTIGNTVASGTVIINELGDEHVSTGYPIVYTSADSVFQIAAHEDVIPLERLYEICSIARSMLKDEHAVGRVIARPFKGRSGEYKRTSNRRDFSLKPIKKTMLEYIKDAGMDVCAVGKIEDIFAGVGITDAVHTKDNMEGIVKTLEYMKLNNRGLIFTNLVDFDMLYGHRNDTRGYAEALMAFDKKLPEIINAMREDDLLVITADHGCDPTTPSTDHSREYIPILLFGKGIREGISIGTRESFADMGKSICDILRVPCSIKGNSFAEDILRSE